MTDVEVGLRASRPEALPAGPHRERLAAMLRAQQVPEAFSEWPLRRYALALAGALACLVMTLAVQPQAGQRSASATSASFGPLMQLPTIDFRQESAQIAFVQVKDLRSQNAIHDIAHQPPLDAREARANWDARERQILELLSEQK